MLLDSLSNCDLIILDSILLLIILFFMFKWFFGQIRQICKEPEGIIKFGQTTFIVLSWGCFIFILAYFIIKPEETNVLHIFLTIVVGFLGTILGLFFSREMIEKLKMASGYKSDILQENKALLGDMKLLVDENIEQREEINKLKKKL